ncbi:MAG: hypothetical protein F4233_07225 [Rhodospirillaceae bacterium]|nr:hypothetical protein [Rhodospirillaceae bacterium]
MQAIARILIVGVAAGAMVGSGAPAGAHIPGRCTPHIEDAAAALKDYGRATRRNTTDIHRLADDPTDPLRLQAVAQSGRVQALATAAMIQANKRLIECTAR